MVVTVILIISFFTIIYYYYYLLSDILFDTKKEVHVIFRDEKTKNKKNSVIFHKDTYLVNGKSLHSRFSDLQYIVCTIPC